MSIAISLLSWALKGKRWEARMNADADRLLNSIGGEAYAAAADLAWREDMGLLRSSSAGHWSRVTLEIGRRLALSEPSTPAQASRVAAVEKERRAA